MFSRRFSTIAKRSLVPLCTRSLTTRMPTATKIRPTLFNSPMQKMAPTQISVRTLRLEPETMEEIEQRVNTVLLCYDKIDPKALTMESHFINDLGLDSLDHVEVIVAMENEFMVEINDNDQESLMSPREICEYLADMWDVSE